MPRKDSLPTNRLGEETSPYLLQHRDNPVHWRPWGPEALAAAAEADKPILLSVGYAACHWCHVMAHESFEDPETAALMNALFVNIKVDREERPDIDSIYQSALALLGQQGGWPLTMFLAPDGTPFWGGTYFPPESRYGRPGFREVLRAVDGLYRQEPDKVARNGAALTEALEKLARTDPGDAPGPGALDAAADAILRQVDFAHGGFLGAPKFPHAPAFELLWRVWRRTGDQDCRRAVLRTLTRMCQGGIYDHLGGGFARYSTDAMWLAPHFEKMLYDNAALIELLTLVWRETGDPLYEARVRETVAWLLRDMIAPPADGAGPDGPRGFCATLDADSEGEEGRYYVWTEAEIDALLGAGAAAFKAAYDVIPTGNWEGKTILNRGTAEGLGDPAEEARLADGRARLLAHRAKRVPPSLDDKVLADWNGQMIAALARAGAVFGEPAWTSLARGAFDFVSARLGDGDRLRHSWRAGRARHAGMLDDYAQMARAALSLCEATGDTGLIDRARAWVAVLDAHFLDAAGGYFLTADDAEALIVRTKSCIDSATPAGNATMVEVLARLWHLTGDDAYRARADAIAAAFADQAARNPIAVATLLNNLPFLQAPVQIVVVGPEGDRRFDALLAAVHAAAPPEKILTRAVPGVALPTSHPAHGKDMIDGKPAAYVCVGPVCSPPIVDPAALAQTLRDHRS